MTGSRHWQNWHLKEGHVGRAVVMVMLAEGGQPACASTDNEVQCATLDGVPFAMKRRALEKNYSPQV